MTNGKRNRTAGHAFERSSAKLLKAIGFPHVVTSRSESRSRDDKKVDLMNKDEGANGRLPYNIQCKSKTTSLPYPKVLAEMPDDDYINVIFHNQTKRSNQRFMTVGQYAILELKDFLKMMEQIRILRDITNTYFDNHTTEEQEEIDKTLRENGL